MVMMMATTNKRDRRTSTRIPFCGKICSFGRSLGTNLDKGYRIRDCYDRIEELPVELLLIPVPLNTVQCVSLHVKPEHFHVAANDLVRQ